MMSESKPKGLLDELTDEQKTRLRALKAEIVLDKLTVSFSIEGRDPNGNRRSAFYSVNAGRGGDEKGWPLDEVRVVRALLSAHVVAATYDDAFRRKVIPFTEETKAERAGIVGSYEKLVAHLLGAGVSKGSGDPSEGTPTNS